MRLSILIPVYNWSISALLSPILREMDECGLTNDVEVIVMDDRSTDEEVFAENTEFLAEQARPYLRFARMERNVGRSVIRNMLAAEASGDFLLFLDCDVLPDAGDFVRSYLACARSNDFDVVCGGISYRTRVMNGAEYDYHAYLGRKKEVKPAGERNKEPWRHILTSNIMVRKSVFQGTSFDERFTGYGYEDIEWGVRLSKSHRILHIDNTVSHLGLVTKHVAYQKMRASVPNYLLLKGICPEAFAASTISKLVRLFEQCGPTALLKLMDRTLRRCFLSGRLSNRHAFVVFQLNFAVLLALELRGEPAFRQDR